MLHSRAHAAPCAAMHHRHPDKNPDNDEATTKFQQISAAYARLSNPDASDDELDDGSGPQEAGGRRQEAGGRRQEFIVAAAATRCTTRRTGLRRV